MTESYFKKAQILASSILKEQNPADWKLSRLGFARIDTSGVSLSVWLPELQTLRDATIHDHPWSFRSTIIHGALVEETYEIVEFGNRYTRVNPPSGNYKNPQNPCRQCLSHIRTTVLSEGETYTRLSQEIHSTSVLGDCAITVLTKSERVSSSLKKPNIWFARRFEDAYEEFKEIDRSGIIERCVGILNNKLS